jgi:hypothetical protein
MRISLFCLLCLSTLALRAADTTTGPFSFAESPIRIPVNTQEGALEITLRSSVPQKTPPSLTDVELPHPPAAVVRFEAINDPNLQANTWRYKIWISGLVLANATQQRYAVVTYGDNKQTISYIITNVPASFSWNISRVPEPWVGSNWLPTPICNEFTVTPKDSPATNVILGASTLVEQSTKEGISVGKLSLCRVDDGGCETAEPINLSANVPSHLRICTAEGFHGNFHGVITLASVQKPDGDTLLQSASFSSFLAKCGGLLLLCVGIYLAWWAKVWARARLERDQSLMPAILMRAQLAALQQILAGLQPKYRDAPSFLIKGLQGLLDELSDSTLDSHQFLPPKFPSPYGYTVDAAGYKAYLEARNPTLQLFSVLVKEGVVRARAEDNGRLTAEQQMDIVDAIKKIDSISANAPQPSPDQAFQSIQPILTNLHNILFPPPAGAPAAVVAPAPPPPASTVETVQLQIQSISKGIWLLYGVLTALSGLAVLILSNPGFGIPLDFIFAFFWGFGLPTTVSALAPGSTASALNISVARG